MSTSSNERQSHPVVGIHAEAFFVIAAGSGEILECNDAAANLLGVSCSALCGQLWSRVIIDASGVLALALAAGKHVSLPPLMLRSAGAAEHVVGGLVMPPSQEQSATHTLLLWRLLHEEQLGLPGLIGAGDTLAVLGVDHLRLGEKWATEDTGHLMQAMRSSTQEIVRSADTVGLPIGTAFILILHDVDLEGARDICSALLSHLHAVHTRPGTQTSDVRICVGLAHQAPHSTSIATLLAANNALLQAQQGGVNKPICTAAEEDQQLILGRAMNNTGVFSEVDGALFASGKSVSEEVTRPTASAAQAPPFTPIETNIQGYVVDNMEGAVDQAVFLAQLDIPVAILGPAGTGKMYVARVIHETSGGAAELLVAIDCREFRNRSAAHTRISRELAQGEGKTLVFKSPHLMSAEVQVKLARQISSRTQADVSPPQYLPRVKLVALFPESLERLVAKGELTEGLASVFAGYPINVPPIRDRKQAVLRWAHKILGQEGAARDRAMKGFSPDAERAMLLYDWPGNISEMRQCIFDALEKTDKDWLTPVDLGLFKGINPDGVAATGQTSAFLTAAGEEDSEEEVYIPSTGVSLDVALGEAVHHLLAVKLVKPLGAWLDDELVLAALDRYRNDMPRTAQFLHTKPRNINRWMPGIQSREEERHASSMWQTPRRLIREWVRESPQLEGSPLAMMQAKLLVHVNEQSAALSAANRAQIMGVSTPTYLKRLREIEDA